MRQIAQVACLENCLRQRLLAIDVFAQPHRAGFGDGVEMIRRGNVHGVNAPADLVKHGAKIPVKFRLRIFPELIGAMRAVHVAQGDDVLAVAAIRVAGALAAGTDDGNVQLAVQVLCAQQGWHAEDHRAGGQRGGLEKIAPVPMDR